MPKLSDTQAIVLSAAAARPDLSLLPVPDTIRLKGAALDRTIRSLLSRGLVSDAVGPGRPMRRSAKHRPARLTPAGLNAIRVEIRTRRDEAGTAADARGRGPQRTAWIAPAASSAHCSTRWPGPRARRSTI